MAGLGVRHQAPRDPALDCRRFASGYHGAHGAGDSMMSWGSGVCESNGIDIHYLRTGGAKPSVILLHGLMGNGACWTPLARALEAEFDVVMPDSRGHGTSSAPHYGYRYDDLASDVVGLIHGLGLSRPLLLGHSMGGMTAAVVASRGAGIIGGLILVDPTFLSPERQQEVRDSDVADQHRRALGLQKSDLVAHARARHPHRSPAIIELQVGARLQTRMCAFDVLTAPNLEYRQVVNAIDVPTLLVIGDSSVVTLEMAEELRSLNPRVRLEQVQNAGHGLPFEQPERLGEVVVWFLRELAPDAAADPRRHAGRDPQRFG
jgi:N-formylmaleamate deformylase